LRFRFAVPPGLLQRITFSGVCEQVAYFEEYVKVPFNFYFSFLLAKLSPKETQPLLYL
jgi:hypothetical protein